MLREVDDPLRIDGHTNQVPVKPKYYPTDWELSAARAITVLRHLNEVGGDPERAADRRPRSATRSRWSTPPKPGSQRVNKRVDIVVAVRPPDGDPRAARRRRRQDRRQPTRERTTTTAEHDGGA